MLNKNIFRTRQHQTGVTIVELMISIVLGLLLLSAATAMTVKSMVINGDTLASAKLNQDLDAVLHVMVNDIRRAGYTGHAPALPGVQFLPNQDLYIPTPSCVLYAYDADGSGSLEDNEKFGFRLPANGTAIEMRTGCSSGACATDCGAGSWEQLTDSSTMTISSLAFDTRFSKCLNISAAGDNGFWVITAEDISEFPCDPNATLDSSDLDARYVDSDAVYQSGTYIKPVSGDRTIETRQVNIEIAGHLGTGAVESDSMVKKQKVAINVRNNLVYTIP